MSATKGRSLRLKVSTTSGGVYTNVAGIENVSLDKDGVTVDVSTLTSAAIEKLLVIGDTKISATGNYEPGDTNGQAAIEAALENGTDLFAEVLYNGTNGTKVQVIPSKFSITAGTKDKLAVSIELEGTGARTTI